MDQKAFFKACSLSAMFLACCVHTSATFAEVVLPYGSAYTFAKVPAPGQPEGIAVDPRDGSVWVGSNKAQAASQIWHFSAQGELLRSYPVDAHAPDAAHGVNGITLDGRGRVYALDYSGARIIRLDPDSGRQTVYATFPDLPLCVSNKPPCEPGLLNRPAWPNWGTFDAQGNLYVSDLNQATIWKVPPGGGTPRIWYQNAAFASIYSLNGMQFDAQGQLNFVLTFSMKLGADFLQGVIYKLPVKQDGSAGELTRVVRMGMGDGMAIGRSGKLYAVISQPFVNKVQVVDPQTGQTLDKLPSAEVQRSLAIPFDMPASAAFSGTRLLVTNHALFSQNPDHFAVLGLEVGEEGLPLHYPLLDDAP